MRAFNIQEASLLEHVRKNLAELIARNKKGCNMGDRPRVLCGNVSSRAKWLLNEIAKLEKGVVVKKDEDGVDIE
jgi:hypothetical protein